MFEEGHTGDHKEEQLLSPQASQNIQQLTGWRKH